MGLVVRFPLERARAIPPLVSSGEGAVILVLPVVSIDRSGGAKSAEASEPQSKPRSRNGRTTRRRTKRPA
jgi:hypothetical protein